MNGSVNYIYFYLTHFNMGGPEKHLVELQLLYSSFGREVNIMNLCNISSHKLTWNQIIIGKPPVTDPWAYCDSITSQCFLCKSYIQSYAWYGNNTYLYSCLMAGLYDSPCPINVDPLKQSAVITAWSRWSTVKHYRHFFQSHQQSLKEKRGNQLRE